MVTPSVAIFREQPPLTAATCPLASVLPDCRMQRTTYLSPCAAGRSLARPGAQAHPPEQGAPWVTRSGFWRHDLSFPLLPTPLPRNHLGETQAQGCKTLAVASLGRCFSLVLQKESDF